MDLHLVQVYLMEYYLGYSLEYLSEFQLELWSECYLVILLVC